MFDPELFGQAMGEAIKKAVAPLRARIESLEKQLAERPDVAALVAEAVKAIPTPKSFDIDPFSADVDARISKAVAEIPAARDGKDADPEVIEKMVKAAVDALPKPKDGDDGKSVTVDDVAPLIKAEVEKAAALIPVPKDGAGIADLMIDRDDCLIATFTDGRMKNLGVVVGKDGISFESFELEYLNDTHEVGIKATCGGRTKELRYPAGGIRPAGYWRDGTLAKAGEAWVHDGSLWIATKDTNTKPETKADGWIIAARRGRDGESVVKHVTPAKPVPLKD